jgi:gamma-glutamyltranspeptidase / glutathione hydrolase
MGNGTNSKGAIASGHPATCRAAAAILDDGGNAFDAALAGMCAACVAEPLLGSLGGGGFLLARPIGGPLAQRTIVYDFFAQTPRQRRSDGNIEFFPINANFGPTVQEFHIGMGSIATPGTVKGLFEAHRDLGYMPLRQIVEPAVRLAREGVRVDAMQAYALQVLRPMLVIRETVRTLFTRRDGSGDWLGEGDILRLPDMADALEMMAIEGEDLFYRGEIARAIAEDSTSQGGFLTRADLESYRIERRAALTCNAFGAELHLNPPPSTGGILIAFALELLREGNLAALGFGTTGTIQRLARVMALTNRARVESRLHELDAGAARDTLLDPALLERYRTEVLGHPSTDRGTTHISVVDRAGNAASLSFSNGEGSGYAVPGTAILLNNMMGEEDINPHGFLQWPCDTRMSSMMAPTLAIEADGILIALGSGGANRLRTAILQVLLNLLVHRLPAPEAIASPRIHFENDRLSLEPGFNEADVERLSGLFPDLHRWQQQNLFFGGVHVASRRPSGEMSGAGDGRRGGAGLVV